MPTRTRHNKAFCLLTLMLFCISPLPAFCGETAGRKAPAFCTYEMQIWNVNGRSTSETRKVRHPYDAVASSETDSATGCTVCSEDQVELVVPGLKPFSVCHTFAASVRALMKELVGKGAAIRTVVGYHAIRSRGPVDADGNRTMFSNHSFGTAVDINPEQNGLYDNCVVFGPKCRLLRGGEWKPGTPGSLTRDDDVVRAFKAVGFKWGGEIAGKQKDFMHFSLTGY